MNLTRWYQLDTPLDPDAVQPRCQALQISLSHCADNTCSIELYDSFDWLLWQKNFLLLRLNDQVNLVQVPKTRLIYSEAVNWPKGDIGAADLPAGLGAEIASLIRPRVVFARLRVDWATSTFAVRDDEDKLIGHLLSHHFSCAGNQPDNSPLAPVYGVEPQPLKGYSAPIKRLRKALQPAKGHSGDSVKLVLAPWVERLFASGYRSKPQLQFTAATPVQQVLQRCISANLDCAQANIDGISRDRDPEFLHDYRVALRRTRALLSLLKEVYEPQFSLRVKQQLGELASRTNTLRDLDVWLLDSDSYRAMLPRELQPGFELLARALAKQRQASLRQVQKFLRAPETLQQLESIHRQFANNDPALHGRRAELSGTVVAAKAVRKHRGKIACLCAQTSPDCADEHIHEIRIECKKLRYLTELFQPIADQEAWQALTGQLKALQDMLGRFNDLAVQQQFLSTTISALARAKNLDPQASLAAGGLLSLLHQQHLAEKHRVLAALKDFHNQPNDAVVADLFPATATVP